MHVSANEKFFHGIIFLKPFLEVRFRCNFCGWFHLYALLMQGSFTGPRIIWSGSSLRTEATGYGLVCNIPLRVSLSFCVYVWPCVCILICIFVHKIIICSSGRLPFSPFFVITFWFMPLLHVRNLKNALILQVFFAQLILADMNKELKGLRFTVYILKA